MDFKTIDYRYSAAELVVATSAAPSPWMAWQASVIVFYNDFYRTDGADHMRLLLARVMGWAA